MLLYLVGYDLKTPGRDYKELFKAITEIANGYSHPIDSTWLVFYPGRAWDLRDLLVPHIDANDRLFVVRLQTDSAWTTSFPESTQEWLRLHIPMAT